MPPALLALAVQTHHSPPVPEFIGVPCRARRYNSTGFKNIELDVILNQTEVVPRFDSSCVGACIPKRSRIAWTTPKSHCACDSASEARYKSLPTQPSCDSKMNVDVVSDICEFIDRNAVRFRECFDESCDLRFVFAKAHRSFGEIASEHNVQCFTG